MLDRVSTLAWEPWATYVVLFIFIGLKQIGPTRYPDFLPWRVSSSIFIPNAYVHTATNECINSKHKSRDITICFDGIATYPTDISDRTRKNNCRHSFLFHTHFQFSKVLIKMHLWRLTLLSVFIFFRLFLAKITKIVTWKCSSGKQELQSILDISMSTIPYKRRQKEESDSPGITTVQTLYYTTSNKLSNLCCVSRFERNAYFICLATYSHKLEPTLVPCLNRQ